MIVYEQILTLLIRIYKIKVLANFDSLFQGLQLQYGACVSWFIFAECGGPDCVQFLAQPLEQQQRQIRKLQCQIVWFWNVLLNRISQLLVSFWLAKNKKLFLTLTKFERSFCFVCRLDFCVDVHGCGKKAARINVQLDPQVQHGIFRVHTNRQNYK